MAERFIPNGVEGGKRSAGRFGNGPEMISVYHSRSANLIWSLGGGSAEDGGWGSHHWTGTIRKRVPEIIDLRKGGGWGACAGTSRAVRESWHLLTLNAISCAKREWRLAS
ncbi:hypothetical protein CDAR_212151 [Caerostris darwini]|uniref:Uncharacterized protein n=1 Tax=Caerostris darwini TaxID=1538125 RepID=A0AAV4NTG2_9ARAC|nr:hypothetical protein CDAR_212151 [Caerostris darwini]